MDAVYLSTSIIVKIIIKKDKKSLGVAIFLSKVAAFPYILLLFYDISH